MTVWGLKDLMQRLGLSSYGNWTVTDEDGNPILDHEIDVPRRRIILKAKKGS